MSRVTNPASPLTPFEHTLDMVQGAVAAFREDGLSSRDRHSSEVICCRKYVPQVVPPQFRPFSENPEMQCGRTIAISSGVDVYYGKQLRT